MKDKNKNHFWSIRRICYSSTWEIKTYVWKKLKHSYLLTTVYEVVSNYPLQPLTDPTQSQLIKKYIIQSYKNNLKLVLFEFLGWNVPLQVFGYPKLYFFSTDGGCEWERTLGRDFEWMCEEERKRIVGCVIADPFAQESWCSFMHFWIFYYSSYRTFYSSDDS